MQKAGGRITRLILLLAFAVASCGDSTAPEWVGLYDLDSFAGRPLPTLIAGEPELTLVSGEIVLRRDGTYHQRTQTSDGMQAGSGTYTSMDRPCSWTAVLPCSLVHR